MKTLDLLPLGEYTHDMATAAIRLDLAVRELTAARDDVATLLFRHEIKGVHDSTHYSPLAVFLHGRVGADVALSGNRAFVDHDDWSLSLTLPAWLIEFADTVAAREHPLIEGKPTCGDVRPADVFAALGAS